MQVPQILVIYYSQSGQLRTLIDRVLTEVQASCQIDYLPIQPIKDFPSPWAKHDFYDCMPECVQLVPEPIAPMQYPEKNYDLIILGYQPWFLSPSIPVNSYLQSSNAAWLRGKKVLTIIGSRNMWLHAQEKVKQLLQNQGAQLVGNIAFFDRNPNLISVLSIDRWAFTGKKEGSFLLPEAGVQAVDIAAANRFGKCIAQAVHQQNFDQLQSNLLAMQAVQIKPSLVILEKRAITNFRKFAPYIAQLGGRGDIQRASRVNLFRRLLWVGIFILSPISNITAKIIALFQSKKLSNEIQYFKEIAYKENAL